MHHLNFRITLLIQLILFSIALPAQNRTVRVGVVVDGRSQRTEESLEILEREVTIILEDEYDVEFPEGKMLLGDWTLPRVSELSDQLLKDPDIDIVISLGFVSSQYVASRKTFDKPTFASIIIDPVLQQIPFEERKIETLRPDETEEFPVSGIKNLNYLLFGGGTLEDVRQLNSIVPFSKMTILVMEALKEAIPSIDSIVAKRSKEMQLEGTVVPVSDSVSETLARIPEDTEVVVVAPLLNFSTRKMDELITALNNRKLPTLSIEGRSEVEQGMLASFNSSDDPVRRSRRIALNIQEALEGTDPAEMSIEYQRDEQLIINMATARLIGISPKYSILLQAELLHEEPQQFARTLSLGAVVREASQVNLELAAAERAVAVEEEIVREVRGPLLPQIGLSGGATIIDSDRARTLPTFAETEFSATLSGRQLVYSDQAWANYSIQKSLRDLRVEQRQELHLDVILEAAAGYLNLLRAQTIERIQKENLNLTRGNLKLASSRVEIGAANRVELFRWESQIAANQRDVVDAESIKNQARIAVNRVLNRPLSEVFATVEATLNDPELVASFESLTPYIDNPKGFSLYSEFMASEALAASPEIKQLDASIRARNRDLKAAQRSFFLPDIDISGGITPVERKGVGSELPPGLNNTDWFVAANATIPLFQGGGRIARMSRAKRQLEELEYQREAVSQRVEERIRSALEAANASFQGIELSRAQSKAAGQNFDLVEDSYAAGVVGILELLDAQNQSLVADLGEANAVFVYLNDLMQVERATGRFDFFRSSQERQDFLMRLDEFYRQRGVIVRHR
jgi:outer membrane protein